MSLVFCSTAFASLSSKDGLLCKSYLRHTSDDDKNHAVRVRRKVKTTTIASTATIIIAGIAKLADKSKKCFRSSYKGDSERESQP